MFFKSIKRAFAPQQLVTTGVTALIVAGVAAAATVGSAQIANNSVTGVDIKNNSIGTADVTNNGLTSVDIKNGSLLGVDLKANTIAGNQVNEATLAKVPSATAADTATTATNATNATTATNAGNADKLDNMDSTAFVSKTENKRVSLRLNAGDPDVTLIENGTLKLYARCTTGATDVLKFYVATTADNAFMEGDADTGDIDVATAEANREFNSFSATTDAPTTQTLYDFSAIIWSSDAKYAISMDEGSGGTFFNRFGKRCGFDGEVHAYIA